MCMSVLGKKMGGGVKIYFGRRLYIGGNGLKVLEDECVICDEGLGL